VTWLAFLDVYLRGKKGHETNRDRIYDLLMKHAGDAGGIPFPEGAGVYGSLTGGAGRSWDNGNFFHMLICGIYGLEKSQAGITISPPSPITSLPLTELKNICWRDAVYHFTWTGEGTCIQKILCDGTEIATAQDKALLDYNQGVHQVEVILGTP
jgi:hypothetical protein